MSDIDIEAVESGLLKAQIATNVLFGTDFSKAKASDITDALRGNPFLYFRDKSEVLDIAVSKLAVKFNLAASNGAFFSPLLPPSSFYMFLYFELCGTDLN